MRPHDRPTLGEYLLLFAIFLLFGLAGGLDQPWDEADYANTDTHVNCKKESEQLRKNRQASDIALTSLSRIDSVDGADDGALHALPRHDLEMKNDPFRIP